ncbi:MAG: D-2-hydroxyacid dehydrogenase [Cytophaga sp.]|uniref:D-2-hydroxyacid dehydrogenase n=1 Tax=Cytophaga sp. TaxID=29535 RepID=UPI003F7D7A56
MNIVFLDALTMGDMPELESFHALGAYTQYAETSLDERLERCLPADIIVTNKVKIDAVLMEKLPKLKLICVAATGTNNIDLDKAAALNIPVKNVKGYSTNSVAQLTFGFIIELFNRITFYDTYVKEEMYSSQKLFTHIGPGLEEIAGKTIGIIGMGDIGKAVAKIATAFNMQVQYYSTSGKNTDAGYACVSLDTLLKTSDVVSIHAPFNAQTSQLIGAKQLAMMKPEAILINVGRGGIVVETDLVEALQEKKIHAAALDVFEQEPLPLHSPLLQLQDHGQLILTPHIAWASRQARITLLQGIQNNIKQFVS